MAKLGQMFDSTQVDPEAPRELLPAGDYEVQIIASQIKETKDGKNQFLALELEVLAEDFAGQKLFDNLNLWHSNAQTSDIAQKRLSAICRAVGVQMTDDTEDLHMIPMMVKVEVEDARTDTKTGKHYGPSNRIKGYRAIEGGQTSAPRSAAPAPRGQAPMQRQAPMQQNQPTAGAPRANAPWRKNAA